MKKKNLAVCIAMAMMIGVAGCSTVENVEAKEDTTEESMFETVETEWNWSVVYHKETRVMYVVSRGSYNGGTFTLMVDSDGNPLLWQE